MQIETKITLQANNKEAKILKIEGDYLNGIATIKKVSVFMRGQYVSGDLYLTWLFIFDEVYTQIEFEQQIEIAIESQAKQTAAKQ